MIYTSVPELPSKRRPIPQPEKVSVRIRKMRDVADSIADKHLMCHHASLSGGMINTALDAVNGPV